MQRRNFIRGFVSAIAAAAVSARLMAQPGEVKIEGETPFDPMAYKGDFRWVNLKEVSVDEPSRKILDQIQQHVWTRLPRAEVDLRNHR